MRKLILLAVMLLSPVFCASALACQCISELDLTPEQIKEKRFKAFETAAAVFTGEVIKVENGKATLTVDRIWKGESVDEIVITVHSLMPDGSLWMTSCDYYLKVGERHLIYAYGKDGDLRTAPCTRSTGYKRLKDIEPEITGLNEINKPEIRNRGNIRSDSSPG